MWSADLDRPYKVKKVESRVSFTLVLKVWKKQDRGYSEWVKEIAVMHGICEGVGTADTGPATRSSRWITWDRMNGDGRGLFG